MFFTGGFLMQQKILHFDFFASGAGVKKGRRRHPY